MEVFLEKENRNITKKFSGTAKLFLERMGINPEEVLVIRNGEIITLDENLEDSDSIKILSVISGG